MKLSHEIQGHKCLLDDKIGSKCILCISSFNLCNTPIELLLIWYNFIEMYLLLWSNILVTRTEIELHGTRVLLSFTVKINRADKKTHPNFLSQLSYVMYKIQSLCVSLSLCVIEPKIYELLLSNLHVLCWS